MLALRVYRILKANNVSRGGKADQPALRLAHKNAGRVGSPRKVIAG